MDEHGVYGVGMHVETLIVGSGFAGLAMAIELDRAGRRNWRIVESAGRLGGTWRDNTYPGAACDVPSHLYSLSRAPNPDWSHSYARQPEILAYMEALVDRFGLRDRIVFDAAVAEARWTGRWEIATAAGPFSSRFLVHGIGALRDPRWPSVPGLDTFAGPVVHSARWPADLDLGGKRVVVVGTGASAVQVVPAIADQAASVTVLQRSAPWVRPRRDRTFSRLRKRVYRTVPAAMRAHRLLLQLQMEAKYPLFFGPFHRHTAGLERIELRRMRGEVHPSLADAVLPTDRIGCKRVLVSDTWYATLARPDVQLITAAATAVEADGVRTAEGFHPADVLICCTGFRVDDPLGRMEVFGREGVSLREQWGGRPSAHLGITVPRFPDMFLLLGPNTALGHTSVLIMIEAAVRYVLQGMSASDVPLEVRPDVHDAFLDWVDTAHARQVWGSGCDSWYRNEDGRNFTIWPGSTWSYRRRTRTFDASDYQPVGT